MPPADRDDLVAALEDWANHGDPPLQAEAGPQWSQADRKRTQKVADLILALAAPREPTAAAEGRGEYGIWCVEDNAWCPALQKRFRGTRAEADAEVVHWSSGLRADVTPGSFHYEVRSIDAAPSSSGQEGMGPDVDVHFGHTGRPTAVFVVGEATACTTRRYVPEAKLTASGAECERLRGELEGTKKRMRALAVDMLSALSASERFDVMQTYFPQSPAPAAPSPTPEAKEHCPACGKDVPWLSLHRLHACTGEKAAAPSPAPTCGTCGDKGYVETSLEHWRLDGPAPEPRVPCPSCAAKSAIHNEAKSLLEWLNGWGDGPNWSDASGMTVPVVKASLRRVLEHVVRDPSCAPSAAKAKGGSHG